jgi:hypothetical protein
LEFEPNCSPIKWTDLQACDNAKEVFDMYAEKGLVSEGDMSCIMDDPELAKEISKHPIVNAFTAIEVSRDIHRESAKVWRSLEVSFISIGSL